MREFSDFAVIAGGAAAALIGLLFVAVSIRADDVGRSAEVRSRVASIVTVLLTILLVWLCVALPNAATWMLGTELIAVGLAASGVLLGLRIRAKKAAGRTRVGRALHVLNPGVANAVLVDLAGLLLLLGSDAGLPVLAVATMLGLISGVAGAWIVLVGPLRAAD